METKSILVAVENNPNGTCKKVLLVQNLTQSDYAKLVNESNISREHGIERAKKIDNQFLHLNEKANEHDLLLAKSIFDNFVDRGLLEDDEKLQKDFYDFIFEGGSFETSNEHFVKIYKKVRGNKYE